ncbi:DUF4386 family protein [Devosia sp.]|uniref:DUF4386 family protein n=1 Tax=Devosia sp. TaxID=1871048 RepID=UPI003A8F46F0
MLALASAIAIVLSNVVLTPAGFNDPTADVFAVYTNHRTSVYLWFLLTGIVMALLLIPVSVALAYEIRHRAEMLAYVILGFSLLWATARFATGLLGTTSPDFVTDLSRISREDAMDVYNVLTAFDRALNQGDTILGGLWLVLMSFALLRGGLPRPLCYLGIAVGVAGISPVVPPLAIQGASVFLLGSTLWFGLAGLAMVRSAPSRRYSPHQTDSRHIPAE